MSAVQANAAASTAGHDEQALRESEERWRTLRAHMQEIVILVDPRGVITYASPSVERWLGYAPDELLGQAPDRDLPPRG